MEFEEQKSYFLKKLEVELPAYLTYHNAAHTQYVVNRAVEIAREEGVLGEELLLVKYAALYHDAGFLIRKEEHEKVGCQIVNREFPDLGFHKKQIDTICGMIMATKIPQNPQTLLEQIIADADLEYLGTDLFDIGSDRLYRELKHFSADLSRKKWLEIQTSFISAHHYHTDFCIQNREPKKKENLQRLRRELETLV
jgi:uncharacterized protein